MKPFMTLEAVREPLGRAGVTLTELMIATAILSVGILGFVGSFRYITKALTVSRGRTLATNLAQEKIESLKNLPYYELLITTASSVDTDITPNITYDNSNYPPEQIAIGGISFTRYTYVTLAQIDDNVISEVAYTYPDTGMKRIAVHVVWSEAGTKKKYGLTNLLENPNVNPLDSTLSGAVDKSSGGGLAGAKVIVQENPDWNTTTDAGGNYSFRVYHGSYTVRASSTGYYEAASGMTVAPIGGVATVPTLTLAAIASGTIAGNVWLSSGLVISQVVVSTKQAHTEIAGSFFYAQYVELYNPTTHTITVGAAIPPVKLNFWTNTCGHVGTARCTDATYGIKLNYVETSVSPSSYYLIANTTTFMVAGNWVTADAYYDDTALAYCSPDPPATSWNLTANPPLRLIFGHPSVDDAGYQHNGLLWLSDSAGNTLDAVGWTHDSITPTNAPGCESRCLAFPMGLPHGEQLIRISSPSASLSADDLNNWGHAYDSDNNSTDFFASTGLAGGGIQFGPRSTGDPARAPIAGRPAVGAFIGTNDPYSGSTQAYAAYIASGPWSLKYAHFELPGVSTGTWTVEVASNSYWREVSTAIVTQGMVTPIPNSVTDPQWPSTNLALLRLSSSTNSGFVEGLVTDANNVPISVALSVGGTGTTSASNGRYFTMASSGSITIVANSGNAPPYVSDIDVLTVETGRFTTKNFILSRGGSVTGYVTSGTTPLPNIVVTANVGGNQYGAGTTGASGVFVISSLSTGSYSVQPVLQPGQDSSPNSNPSVTVIGGGTVHAGTFTVSGAFANLTGSVQYNGETVTSGALILASSNPISATPAQIYGSSAPAQVVLYAVSSEADGTYTLPLRGASTYYLSVYVPVISGSSVLTTTKTYSNIYVSPGETKTHDITVP